MPASELLPNEKGVCRKSKSINCFNPSYGAFTLSARENNLRGCENILNPDSKVNCIKLNRINRKLNEVIRLLSNGSGYPDYPVREIEYVPYQN